MSFIQEKKKNIYIYIYKSMCLMMTVSVANFFI